MEILLCCFKREGSFFKLTLVFTLFFEGSVQEIHRRDAKTDQNKENNNRSAKATL